MLLGLLDVLALVFVHLALAVDLDLQTEQQHRSPPKRLHFCRPLPHSGWQHIPTFTGPHFVGAACLAGRACLLAGRLAWVAAWNHLQARQQALGDLCWRSGDTAHSGKGRCRWAPARMRCVGVPIRCKRGLTNGPCWLLKLPSLRYTATYVPHLAVNSKASLDLRFLQHGGNKSAQRPLHMLAIQQPLWLCALD
jgi:hypothetical protein